MEGTTSADSGTETGPEIGTHNNSELLVSYGTVIKGDTIIPAVSPWNKVVGHQLTR